MVELLLQWFFSWFSASGFSGYSFLVLCLCEKSKLVQFYVEFSLLKLIAWDYMFWFGFRFKNAKEGTERSSRNQWNVAYVLPYCLSAIENKSISCLNWNFGLDFLVLVVRFSVYHFVLEIEFAADEPMLLNCAYEINLFYSFCYSLLIRFSWCTSLGNAHYRLQRPLIPKALAEIGFLHHDQDLIAFCIWFCFCSLGLTS